LVARAVSIHQYLLPTALPLVDSGGTMEQ